VRGEVNRGYTLLIRPLFHCERGGFIRGETTVNDIMF